MAFVWASFSLSGQTVYHTLNLFQPDQCRPPSSANCESLQNSEPEITTDSEGPFSDDAHSNCDPTAPGEIALEDDDEGAPSIK